MAVENKFVNATLEAGLDKAANILKSDGRVTVNSGPWESAAADSDGSVYAVFPIPSNAIPLPGGAVRHDSITNGTGFTYGLYELVNGVFVDVDENLFKTSATHANTTANDPFELAMTVDNAGKMIWELLGLASNPHKQYWWCITGGTVGDGGTFNVYAQYDAQG